MTSKIKERLQKELTCEIKDDPISKQLYSSDASLYSIQPIVIVIPRTYADIEKIVAIAKESATPIIPRGAATGVTGGCVGHGIIIDLSKYLKKVISINPSAQSIHVQSGCILDDVNQALLPYGLTMGPDTTTSNRATIGGMIANNAAGMYSITYGTTKDSLEAVTLLTAEGIVSLKNCQYNELVEKAKEPTYEGYIYKRLLEFYKSYKDSIEKEFPKLNRLSSGYNLDIFHDSTINLARLIAASEGTLGIILDATFSLYKKEDNKLLIVIPIYDLITATKHVPNIMQFNPHAFELIDHTILSLAKTHPQFQSNILLEKECKALFLIECAGVNAKYTAEHIINYFKNTIDLTHYLLLDTPEEIHTIWNIRKAGLSLLLSQKNFIRACAFIEDIALPCENVSSFLKVFIEYIESKNRTVGIYGHLGAGCLHIRPYFDVRDADERNELLTMMDFVQKEVYGFHGVLSGEHGDGFVRSWLNPKIFSPTIFNAFLEIKSIFDPMNLMNPMKIVPPYQSIFDNMRIDTVTTPSFTPYLDYSNEGGIHIATTVCNNNGQCRKKSGIMCPSYQATLDEKDSTRARAQALRGIIDGTLSKDLMYTDAFKDVMDLCLSCKGCLRECPSQVNMAKLKAEYQYQTHQFNYSSIRTYLFGYIRIFLTLGSYIPKITNYLIHSPFYFIFAKLFKLSANKRLPHLQPYQGRVLTKYTSKLVLFCDTFTQFFNGLLIEQTVELLEKIGYTVEIYTRGCCGRSFFSKGLLEQAEKTLIQTTQDLSTYISQGNICLFFEPSCLSMFLDELSSFKTLKKESEIFREYCQSVDAFLWQHLDKLKTLFPKKPYNILIHSHCHAKAHNFDTYTYKILYTLSSGDVREIPSGCCGMAGSFGYEAEHEQLSDTIGNLILFPTIKQYSSHDVVSNGFSCRCHIESALQKKSYHLVSFLSNW